MTPKKLRSQLAKASSPMVQNRKAGIGTSTQDGDAPMVTKAKSTSTTDPRITELETQVNKLQNELGETMREAAKVTMLNMEIATLKRRLELAQLIAEGKQVEALACLFRKDTYVFALDIRMDDSTYQAARKEIAEKAIADHEVAKLSGGTWKAHWEGKKLICEYVTEP